MIKKTFILDEVGKSEFDSFYEIRMVIDKKDDKITIYPKNLEFVLKSPLDND